MSTWGKFASMFDLSGAWKVVRSPATKGAFWDAFGAYFTGRNMGDWGALTRSAGGITTKKAASIASAMTAPDVLKAGVRIGGAAALGGGAMYAATRTEPGRKAMGVAVPFAGAAGVYAGARYGLGKIKPGASGWRGLASNPLQSRGLATVAGLGAFVGLRGGF